MFGSQSPAWSSTDSAFLTVFQTMMYDYDLEAMQDTFPVMANVWYISYMMLVTNMMLWMFLGIILGSYDAARAKAHGSPTLLDDAEVFARSLPPWSGWVHLATGGLGGKPHAGVGDVLRALRREARAAAEEAEAGSSSEGGEGGGGGAGAAPGGAALPAPLAAAPLLTPQQLVARVPHLTLATATDLVVDSLTWCRSLEGQSSAGAGGEGGAGGAGGGGGGGGADAAQHPQLQRRSSEMMDGGAGLPPSYKATRAAIASQDVDVQR